MSCRAIPSEAFVETLVAQGMTELFGTMGSTFMDAIDIFAPAGICLTPVVNSYQHNASFPASTTRGDDRR
ncbi:hypothetical protein [Halomonas heilongjiangensis]|uniref:Thiamine pyrophosphate enzyme N-terminal TPP-binding domain-containing protein n=1 Tax=Halomonas heilongjiangensis TaxID=1387883 RepID=A0A2N7TGP3_9GAMM|nr:hypothetical protein [Halomonas heilongjiangensis]PMR67355.1 hypothetical protein C1H66_19965 [Halomonas heilongjiangensis]PXX88131.1 hypothetical protein CR158_15730 [Halomonas heilongjiangensis]